MSFAAILLGLDPPRSSAETCGDAATLPLRQRSYELCELRRAELIRACERARESGNELVFGPPCDAVQDFENKSFTWGRPLDRWVGVLRHVELLDMFDPNGKPAGHRSFAVLTIDCGEDGTLYATNFDYRIQRAKPDDSGDPASCEARAILASPNLAVLERWGQLVMGGRVVVTGTIRPFSAEGCHPRSARWPYTWEPKLVCMASVEPARMSDESKALYDRAGQVLTILKYAAEVRTVCTSIKTWVPFGSAQAWEGRIANMGADPVMRPEGGAFASMREVSGFYQRARKSGFPGAPQASGNFEARDSDLQFDLDEPSDGDLDGVRKRVSPLYDYLASYRPLDAQDVLVVPFAEAERQASVLANRLCNATYGYSLLYSVGTGNGNGNRSFRPRHSPADSDYSPDKLWSRLPMKPDGLVGDCAGTLATAKGKP